jgi:hypothetical protein
MNVLIVLLDNSRSQNPHEVGPSSMPDLVPEPVITSARLPAIEFKII